MSSRCAERWALCSDITDTRTQIPENLLILRWKHRKRESPATLTLEMWKDALAPQDDRARQETPRHCIFLCTRRRINGCPASRPAVGSERQPRDRQTCGGPQFRGIASSLIRRAKFRGPSRHVGTPCAHCTIRQVVFDKCSPISHLVVRACLWLCR